MSSLSARIVRFSPAHVLAATVAELVKHTNALFRAYRDRIAAAIGGVVKAAAWGYMTVGQALAAAVPAVTAFLAGLLGIAGLGDRIRSLVRGILDRLT